MSLYVGRITSGIPKNNDPQTETQGKPPIEPDPLEEEWIQQSPDGRSIPYPTA